jgi:hypothetical protein
MAYSKNNKKITSRELDEIYIKMFKQGKTNEEIFYFVNSLPMVNISRTKFYELLNFNDKVDFDCKYCIWRNGKCEIGKFKEFCELEKK